MNRPTPLSPDRADGLSPPAGEHLSALVDGELAASALPDLWREDEASLNLSWGRYQLIGEALRAGAALPADTARVASIMAAVRAETVQAPAVAVPSLPQAAAMPMPTAVPAANDEVFRWKMLAGFAALAAAAAVIWNVTAVAPGLSGPQLAQTAPVAPATATPPLALADNSASSAPVLVSGEQGPILRDRRLEELMAAHRQAGGMSALQMPAGFLRSATFELPGGER